MKKLILISMLAINLMALNDKEELVKYIKENVLSLSLKSSSTYPLTDWLKYKFNTTYLNDIIHITFKEDKNITTIPNSFATLNSLVSLTLNGTNIKTLPNDLYKIKSLKYLFLSNIGFTQIPPVILKIPNLSYLDLSHNNLKELPREIFNLRNLNYLYLNDNKLQTLPENFFDSFLESKDILEIDISNNRLSFLDKSICNINKSILRFNFSGNPFNKFPSCIDFNKTKIVLLNQNGEDIYIYKKELLEENDLSIGDIATIDYSNESDRKVKFDIVFGENIDISEYFWEFGDGNYSTQKSPTYEYSNFGEFNVTLALNGSEFKTSKKIEIKERILNFKKGWNLISNPTKDDINISIFDRVLSYENGKWIEPKYLTPQKGYFVKLKEDFDYRYSGNAYKVLIPTKNNIWYLMGSGERINNFGKHYIRYIYKDKEWILNPKEIEVGIGFWLNRGDFNTKEKLVNFLNENAFIYINGEFQKSISVDDLENITKVEFRYKENLKELPSTIEFLTNLETLDISYSAIEKLPKELFNLTNLKNLIMSENSITEISKEIKNLVNLETFIFSSKNNFDIPKEIFELTNLKKLFFTDSGLKTLSPDIKNLINLKELSLRNNQLKTLPIELFNLKKLKYLGLESNNLTSFNGDEFSNLEALEGLELSKNNLNSFPSPLKAFSNLKSLFINENKITTIPKDINSLKELTNFSANENEFTSLPSKIGELKKLKYLFLTNNKITSIPNAIGGLESLEVLQIDRNNLVEISDNIGNLKNLTNLLLGDNNLTILPAGIGGLEKVRAIDLIRNQLTSLPSEIGKLDNLIDIILMNNNLTSLPKEIGDMDSLRYLSLWNNQITTLPKEIGNAPHLERIDLDNNPIVELPLSLANLKGLTLSLNNTPFSKGIVEVPSEIKASASNIYLQ